MQAQARHYACQWVCEAMLIVEEALNWEPKVQLDEGLVKVIEYMKEIDWNCVRMPNLVNNMDTIMNPKM